MAFEHTELIDASDEEDEDGDESSDEVQQVPRKNSVGRDKASWFVRSNFWSYFLMTMIVTNIALMALEAQYPEVVDRPHFWNCVELFFLVFFTFEIGLRLYISGCQEFFCTEGTERLWNWTDFGIVFMGLMAMIIRPTRYGWSAGLNAEDNSVSSSLLLLRGLRIIRVIRLFEQLRQLDLLIRGMVKSFEAVFWILLLGFLFILIFAIAVTTVVGHHSNLWGHGSCPVSLCEDDDERRIKEYFGDLGRSMWTMFQFVTLDEWASIIRLVSKRMLLMKYFFLFYTLLASFALISLLTGVMAEHIMSESLECQKEEERKEVMNYTKSLKKLFEQQGDADVRKGLTLEQLHSMMDDQQAVEHLRKLGVNDCFTPDDLNDVFHAMDMDGDGMLTWEEFERGLKNLHGTAGARELAMVRADVQRLLKASGPDAAILRQTLVSPYPQAQAVPVPSARSSLTVQALNLAQDAACSQSLGLMEERMGRLESMIKELVKAKST